mmetsp:Transcript_776/g.2213  ORF Transcript_776/g.2213 Transcript_776/m.2213 type:complete len:395 (+) Transcript_776:942-2126(+)
MRAYLRASSRSRRARATVRCFSVSAREARDSSAAARKRAQPRSCKSATRFERAAVASIFLRRRNTAYCRNAAKQRPCRLAAQTCKALASCSFRSRDSADASRQLRNVASRNFRCRSSRTPWSQRRRPFRKPSQFPNATTRRSSFWRRITRFAKAATFCLCVVRDRHCRRLRCSIIVARVITRGTTSSLRRCARRRQRSSARSLTIEELSVRKRRQCAKHRRHAALASFLSAAKCRQRRVALLSTLASSTARFHAARVLSESLRTQCARAFVANSSSRHRAHARRSAPRRATTLARLAASASRERQRRRASRQRSRASRSVPRRAASPARRAASTRRRRSSIAAKRASSVRSTTDHEVFSPRRRSALARSSASFLSRSSSSSFVWNSSCEMAVKS